jgi:broad specificity phosphatase PhoE
MRSAFRWLVALSVLVVLAGCATSRGREAGVTYVLVRHAEKADDDPRDPSLSAAGVKRAARLAERLHFMPVVGVYATAFRRTQQTAAAVAKDHGLAVTTYDASQPAASFVETLRAAHDHGAVVIVGHSNTVPAIAAALCGCQIAPTAETEFGRRISITVLPDGRATVDDRREP